MPVHPDVAALLALQSDDAEVYAVERELGAVAPRLAELDAARAREEQALARARDAMAREDQRHRDLRDRIAQHKELQEKHQQQLDGISNMRQATAAMSQLEHSKRMIADAEREADVISRRVAEQRRAVEEREAALQTMLTEHAAERQTLEAQQAELHAKRGEAVARRDGKAVAVPRSLLSRYDRIRVRKREQTVVPLRGASCSNCDTALPLQRRNTMVGSAAVEICEGCGVLLYAAD